MKKLMFIIILTIVIQINGRGQILIGGKEGNTIYSSVANKVEYIGDYDCQELSIKIEGYDENINFENCVFEITYLRFDTSRLEIVNRLDKVVFETILIKSRNGAKGYVQIGDKLLIEGSIQKRELELLNKIEVKYECPWVKEPQIYGFNLIVVDEDGEFLHYEISGNIIPKNIRLVLLSKSIA